MELAVESLQCRLQARRRYSRERAFQSQQSAEALPAGCKLVSLSLPARAGSVAAGASGGGPPRDARAREEWRARGARGARRVARVVRVVRVVRSHTSKLEVNLFE